MILINCGTILVTALQLMDVLNRPDMESIIAWKPHSRAFVILNPHKLEQEILPSIFKQSSMASFTRQLNLWNFKRLNRRGKDFKCYYHELFLRGRPRLAGIMTRTRVKGVGTKRTSIPQNEPNFYEMKPVHPCNSNAAVHIQTTASDTNSTVSGMSRGNILSRGGGSSVADQRQLLSNKKAE